MSRSTLFQDRCHLPIVSLFLILVLFILKFCACSHFQLTSHQNWLCSNTDWSDYYVRMFLSSFCTTLIVCDRSWGGVCNLLTMLHIVWNVTKARKESGNVASAICWFHLIHCTVGVLSRESIFHNNFIQESWLTTFLSYSSNSLTWICSSFVYEIHAVNLCNETLRAPTVDSCFTMVTRDIQSIGEVCKLCTFELCYIIKQFCCCFTFMI